MLGRQQETKRCCQITHLLSSRCMYMLAVASSGQPTLGKPHTTRRPAQPTAHLDSRLAFLHRHTICCGPTAAAAGAGASARLPAQSVKPPNAQHQIHRRQAYTRDTTHAAEPPAAQVCGSILSRALRAKPEQRALLQLSSQHTQHLSTGV